MISHVILGLLREGRLRHGYELITEYRARLGSPTSTGNFYRELAHLEEQGLVETGINPPGVDARRIPYCVSEKGKRTFDRWLLNPPLNDGELAGWILFIDRLTAAERDRQFDRWQEQLLLRSQDLWRQHRAIAISETGGRDPATGYKPLRVLLARQMKHVEADLVFLEELRSDFKVWLEHQHGLRDKAPDAAAPDPILAEPVEETRRRRARS
jgi:DNA-binding PadR family transcriptional regulator